MDVSAAFSAAGWEIPVAVAVLAAAALAWSGRLSVVPVLLGGGLAGLATLAVLAALGAPAQEPVNRPLEVAEGGYASSDACRSCHPSQHASWHASYHRTMTQVVTPETVATELDGVVLGDEDVRYRFERDGERYFVVETRGAGQRGSSRRMEVVMSTGSHHMQLFWAATGLTRRVEMIPFHWLVKEQRWIPRRASFVTPPGEEAYGTDWNTGCILCHSTRGEPRVQSGAQMDTRAVEFGIACEACHGPGAEHVRINHDPGRRYGYHYGDGPDPTIVNPRRLDKERSAEVCGRCHAYAVAAPGARRDYLWSGYDYEPGDDLSQHRVILSLEDVQPLAEQGMPDGRFWPDGMVRGAGREYGALRDTPCFQRGELTCLSCHAMHPSPDDPRPLEEWAVDQLAPGMDGDPACLQCHASERFAGESHTRHAPGSPGAECMNCHMPYTTLGLLKAIRSHQVTSPSVASSLETGRPNACNQCHLDATLAWSAERLHAWYGQPVPALNDEQRQVAASVLWLLRGDAAQRALMAWSFGWEPAREVSGQAWMPPYLGQLLEDPYAVVRFIAHRSLRAVPGYEDFAFDYVAAEPEPARAHRRALERWQRPASNGLEALLLEGGVLREEAFARLLAERDDRPVVVVE